MVQELRALGIQHKGAGMRMWGNEPELSDRAASALNCSVMSPAPFICFSFTENIFFIHCAVILPSPPQTPLRSYPPSLPSQYTTLVPLLRKEIATGKYHPK